MRLVVKHAWPYSDRRALAALISLIGVLDPIQSAALRQGIPDDHTVSLGAAGLVCELKKGLALAAAEHAASGHVNGFNLAELQDHAGLLMITWQQQMAPRVVFELFSSGESYRARKIEIDGDEETVLKLANALGDEWEQR